MRHLNTRPERSRAGEICELDSSSGTLTPAIQSMSHLASEKTRSCNVTLVNHTVNTSPSFISDSFHKYLPAVYCQKYFLKISKVFCHSMRDIPKSDNLFYCIFIITDLPDGWGLCKYASTGSVERTTSVKAFWTALPSLEAARKRRWRVQITEGGGG